MITYHNKDVGVMWTFLCTFHAAVVCCTPTQEELKR